MESDRTVLIFSGPEMEALALKAMLEEAGIGVMERNEFRSGVMAGFYAGAPSESDLYVAEHDAEAAGLLIAESRPGSEDDLPTE